MNTNPDAIQILCFGDSNTRGRHPNGVKERYPANVRWTGLLQDKLGDRFEIIEEGVSGRTTVLDIDGNSAKHYLKPCLGSHNPLDSVVLMLGTNDMIASLNQSAQMIANGIEELIKIIQQVAWDKNGNLPKIIMLTPPPIDESVPIAKEKFKGAQTKLKQLIPLLQTLAQKHHCEFIDITKHLEATKIDGYHLDPEGHKLLSELLEQKVKEMFL